ncbi:MAG: PIN domain-containing protein [Sphingobacteriales bacterium]
MKRVFIDSDIILDALLKRPGFELPAINLLALAAQSGISAATSSIAFMNVHYFLDKFERPNKIVLLKNLRSFINIIEIGKDEIDLTLNSNFTDFEDAVQYFAAISAKADVIVTRNIKDYKQANIPVLTAEQFLKTL